MAIFRNIPNTYYSCNDGTYSDHDRQGACNYHGGLNGETFSGTSGDSQIEIFDIPLNKIKTNEKWFQNRSNLYSTRSVQNIMDAVLNDSFKWVNFDPITLFLHKGIYYILSGHSRTEGFRQLAEMGLAVDGIGFGSIPSKIITDISLEEAKRIARESNTLSTKESDLERAAFYARMRDEGASKKEITETAKRLEGKNWSKIVPYSYLNTNGKIFAALQALENNTEASSSIIKEVARWIGNARKNLPLTDSHENELYEWLIVTRAYGTGTGKIRNEILFKNRLNAIVQRKTKFGVLDDRLNIENNITKSPSQAMYDQQTEELKNEVSQLEKDLKLKVIELANNGADETTIQRITAGMEASLRRKRIELQNLLLQKGKIIEQSRNELNLFDGISGIRQNSKNIKKELILFGCLYLLLR